MCFRTGTGSLEDTITVDNCFINYLEHVEITVKVKAGYRGDMELYLSSPNGASDTRLLRQRWRDTTSSAIDHRFMSVHQWGEIANGNWMLRVVDAYGGNGKK